MAEELPILRREQVTFVYIHPISSCSKSAEQTSVNAVWTLYSDRSEKLEGNNIPECPQCRKPYIYFDSE